MTWSGCRHGWVVFLGETGSRKGVGWDRLTYWNEKHEDGKAMRAGHTLAALDDAAPLGPAVAGLNLEVALNKRVRS